MECNKYFLFLPVSGQSGEEDEAAQHSTGQCQTQGGNVRELEDIHTIVASFLRERGDLAIPVLALCVCSV